MVMHVYIVYTLKYIIKRYLIYWDESLNIIKESKMGMV